MIFLTKRSDDESEAWKTGDQEGEESETEGCTVFLSEPSGEGLLGTAQTGQAHCSPYGFEGAGEARRCFTSVAEETGTYQMICNPVIAAVRALPKSFASDERTEICEGRGFLIASRPGAESLVWRMGRNLKDETGKMKRIWVPVSEAGGV